MTEQQQRLLHLALDVIGRPELAKATPGPYRLEPNYPDSDDHMDVICDARDRYAPLAVIPQAASYARRSDYDQEEQAANAELFALAWKALPSWVADELMKKLDLRVTGAVPDQIAMDRYRQELGRQWDFPETAPPFTRIASALVALGRLSVEEARGALSDR